ncbi:hypothetical protein D3C71_848790 [compost metagenome]
MAVSDVFSPAECAVEIWMSPMRPLRDQYAGRDRAYADPAYAEKHRNHLNAGLLAGPIIRRWHTALPCGSDIRAGRRSDQPWRSCQLGDRFQRKASHRIYDTLIIRLGRSPHSWQRDLCSDPEGKGQGSHQHIICGRNEAARTVASQSCSSIGRSWPDTSAALPRLLRQRPCRKRRNRAPDRRRVSTRCGG